jgi:glycerol-3-phosphate acyltransferase PlsY
MLVGALVWAVVLAASRTSSVASLSAILVVPVASWAFGKYEAASVLAAIAAIVIWKHRANIARLRAGTEPKVGAKS